MGFLLKWLGLRSEGATLRLRPRRDVVLALGSADAFRLCRRAIEETLGANVSFSDPGGDTIEAGFGVVQSERIRCTLTPIDAFQTRVRIEALRPAGVQPSERSRNVDALANALERSEPLR